MIKYLKAGGRRGVLTVEAAVIFPFILLILYSLIACMIVNYKEAILKNTVYSHTVSVHEGKSVQISTDEGDGSNESHMDNNKTGYIIDKPEMNITQKKGLLFMETGINGAYMSGYGILLNGAGALNIRKVLIEARFKLKSADPADFIRKTDLLLEYLTKTKRALTKK